MPETIYRFACGTEAKAGDTQTRLDSSCTPVTLRVLTTRGTEQSWSMQYRITRGSELWYGSDHCCATKTFDQFIAEKLPLSEDTAHNYSGAINAAPKPEEPMPFIGACKLTGIVNVLNKMNLPISDPTPQDYLALARRVIPQYREHFAYKTWFTMASPALTQLIDKLSAIIEEGRINDCERIELRLLSCELETAYDQWKLAHSLTD